MLSQNLPALPPSPPQLTAGKSAKWYGVQMPLGRVMGDALHLCDGTILFVNGATKGVAVSSPWCIAFVQVPVALNRGSPTLPPVVTLPQCCAPSCPSIRPHTIFPLQGWGNGGQTFKSRDGYKYNCASKCGNTGNNFQCQLLHGCGPGRLSGLQLSVVPGTW